MKTESLQQLAGLLDDARRQRRAVARLTLANPDLTLEDAYAVQDLGMDLRRKAGEARIGFKMGLTSEAKRAQMGLGSPIYGQLTDRMRIDDGGRFTVSEGIHPKVEPELAFRVDRALRAPLTLEDAAAACGEVVAALEILDSRYEGFKYFSLPDVVADNASSSHFVLATSGWPLQGLALDRLKLVMQVNGEVKQQATSDAISGHPLRSLVALVELLAARGESLPAGSVVLAGAATGAEPVRAGDEVRLLADELPPVRFRVA